MPNRPDLYWEHHAGRLGSGLLDQQWKGVRRDAPVDARCFEIFDIVADPVKPPTWRRIEADLMARFESLFMRWPHCHPKFHSATVKWRWFRNAPFPAVKWLTWACCMAPTKASMCKARSTGSTRAWSGGNFGVGHCATPLLHQGTVCTVKAGGRLELSGGHVPLNNAVVHLEPGGQVVFFGFTADTLPRHQGFSSDRWDAVHQSR